MVGGSSIVFTRTAVVEGTLNLKPSKKCESIVGIHVRQYFPNSMCQFIGMYFILYMSEIDKNLQRFKHKKRTRQETLNGLSRLTFNETDSSVKWRPSTQQKIKKM